MDTRYKQLVGLLDKTREAKLGNDWQSRIYLDHLEHKVLQELAKWHATVS